MFNSATRIVLMWVVFLTSIFVLYQVTVLKMEIAEQWWTMIGMVIGAFFGGRKPETVPENADVFTTTTSTTAKKDDSSSIKD